MDAVNLCLSVLILISSVSWTLVEATSNNALCQVRPPIVPMAAIVNTNIESAPHSNNQTRKRGRRGGVRVRTRKRGVKKPFLPVIILGNVRSLANKTDELFACVRHFYEYRECSAMCFTETWLPEDMSDNAFFIDGFTLIRADRTPESGKKTGGGVCLYLNNQWTHVNNITVKQRICTPDLELLSVNVRPFYLPREFTQVIFNVVYIPPSANAEVASNIINDHLNQQASQYPDTLRLIMGDFNHCTLSSVCPQLTQYVTCPTRLEKILDLCYGNVKNAYKSTTLPPLGQSDHNIVHLTPAYRPRYKRIKPVEKTVHVWTEEATEQLRDCFATTDWSVFTDDCEDINDLNNVVTSYIKFCADIVIPSKLVKCYSNNKPWVTKELKETLNKKKKAFKENNLEQVKQVNRDLKSQIALCKKNYKSKIESSFESNDTKSAWVGMKMAAGLRSEKTEIRVANEQQYANDLNCFYGRFDKYDFKIRCQELKRELEDNNDNDLEVCEDEVRQVLKRVKVQKAKGPDNISGTILKCCCDELSNIFTFLFNMSLRLKEIPTQWKTAEVIPLPKKPKFVGMNDLRPVALTPIVMKCFEKLVFSILKKEVSHKLDPLQFAYKANRSVEDAVLVFVNNVLRHLERPQSYVRVLFVDFSSAFNTIQPHLMTEKLLTLNVNKNLVSWLLDFLTKRTQHVKLNNTYSDIIELNTGAPQGCVLSPTLYTLYTNDYNAYHKDTVLIKFADDSALQGLISSDETYYKEEIHRFIEWCKSNYLILNVAKTKEMVIDFRRKKNALSETIIDGERVETVQTYKYLGLIIDDKLNWHAHVHNVCKKLNQRLYFLRKLKSFEVSESILKVFYASVIESIIVFGINCWGASITSGDKEKLNKIIKKAEKIVKCNFSCVDTIYSTTCVNKLKAIINDPNHPLSEAFIRSGRSNRIIQPVSRTERYRNSFVPSAVRATRTRSITL